MHFPHYMKASCLLPAVFEEVFQETKAAIAQVGASYTRESHEGGRPKNG